MTVAVITRNAVFALLTIILLLPTLSAQAAAPFTECFPASSLFEEWRAYTFIGNEIDPESEIQLSADNIAFWFDVDGEPLTWLGDGSDIPEGKEHIFGINFGYRGMPAEALRVGMLISENAAVWIFLEPDNGDDLWLVLYTPDGPCGAYYVSFGHLAEPDEEDVRQAPKRDHNLRHEPASGQFTF